MPELEQQAPRSTLGVFRRSALGVRGEKPVVASIGQIARFLSVERVRSTSRFTDYTYGGSSGRTAAEVDALIQADIAAVEAYHTTQTGLIDGELVAELNAKIATAGGPDGDGWGNAVSSPMLTNHPYQLSSGNLKGESRSTGFDSSWRPARSYISTGLEMKKTVYQFWAYSNIRPCYFKLHWRALKSDPTIPWNPVVVGEGDVFITIDDDTPSNPFNSKAVVLPDPASIETQSFKGVPPFGYDPLPSGSTYLATTPRSSSFSYQYRYAMEVTVSPWQFTPFAGS